MENRLERTRNNGGGKKTFMATEKNLTNKVMSV